MTGLRIAPPIRHVPTGPRLAETVRRQKGTPNGQERVRGQYELCDTTEDRLRELFQGYGEVTRVSIITDRDTGRPRGFAFVEMATDEAANAAIAALDGQQVDGRTLRVNEARPRRSGGDRPDRDRW